MLSILLLNRAFLFAAEAQDLSCEGTELGLATAIAAAQETLYGSNRIPGAAKGACDLSCEGSRYDASTHAHPGSSASSAALVSRAASSAQSSESTVAGKGGSEHEEADRAHAACPAHSLTRGSQEYYDAVAQGIRDYVPSSDKDRGNIEMIAHLLMRTSYAAALPPQIHAALVPAAQRFEGRVLKNRSAAASPMSPVPVAEPREQPVGPQRATRSITASATVGSGAACLELQAADALERAAQFCDEMSQRLVTINRGLGSRVGIKLGQRRASENSSFALSRAQLTRHVHDLQLRVSALEVTQRHVSAVTSAQDNMVSPAASLPPQSGPEATDQQSS